MARWNHFGKPKYRQILFSDVKVHEKFRNDLFKNKRRRSNIIMVKTGNLSYKELKSGKEHTAVSDTFIVSHFSELNQS